MAKKSIHKRQRARTASGAEGRAASRVADSAPPGDDSQGGDLPSFLTLADDHHGGGFPTWLKRPRAVRNATPRYAPRVLGHWGMPVAVMPRNPALSRRENAGSRQRGGYGWVADMPDARDHAYAAPMAVSLPAQFDLRDHFQLPAVYNQGNLGSCTANALAGAIQFERMRQSMPDGGELPSRLFIYYNERVIEGTVASDSGAQLRDGIKSIASQGDCFEGSAPGHWPYVISQFKKPPPAACYKAALLDRAIGYSRVSQVLEQMKGCLASGFPFVFGFTVYPEFESPQVAKDGIVPMPDLSKRAIGGHAVMAVGYDDASQRFTVRNSWGADWGSKGYFTIPYAYLMNDNLASDFWTIRVVSGSTVAK
jgi:C1A family cysteine protease